MALSRFLRRGAALVLRSSSVSACASRPFSQPHPQGQGQPGSGLLRLARAFSSSLSLSAEKPATTTTTDASLLRVIESEIKCAEESDDHEHDPLEDTPQPQGFPFHIDDQKGMNIVRLTRTYQASEHIEVIVSMPSLVTGDHEDDDHEDDDDTSPPQSHIPITVRVSKDDAGPTLEFACTAYPDEVVIDSMSVIENRPEEDELVAYEGPDFNDLNENLQKALHKYLELRGITPLNTNFLHEYMINKDSREYLLWLRNLKAFVQK